MKIGYVLKRFPKLSETFILNEIIELKKKGNEIMIFSIYPSEENIIHPEVEGFNLLENVFYLPDPQKLINKIKFRLKSLGFFGWEYPSESLKDKILSIAVAKYFSEIAKRLKLDVLHAHFNGIATQVAMLMSKRLDIPFTFTTHGFDIFKEPNIRALKKRSENASAVIVTSYYSRNYIHNLTHIDERKIYVVRDCANIDKFKTIKKKVEDYPIILTVARLVEKKGIKYAILTIKELTNEYPKIQYRIIGSGHLKEKLVELTKVLHLDKNVKFLGDQDSDSVAKENGKATIVLLPCIRANNGDLDVCPVVLQEAMLGKIPVVSTNIGSIPELIENKNQGFLVEPKNVKQLANATKKLLENKNLRIKMGKNGKRKIQKEFNIHKEVGKLLKIWTIMKPPFYTP